MKKRRNMIKKYLMVLVVALLFVISSMGFAAAKTKILPAQIIIKGFYVGMDIEEAKKLSTELLDDNEAVVEESTEEGKKIFFIKNVYKLKKENLKPAGAFAGPNGSDRLWNSLIEMGYINEFGRVQDKFLLVEKPDQIEFSLEVIKILRENDAFAAAQVSVYNILKMSGMQPKCYYKIVTDSNKKVKYIYFSGGSADKLFNTEGVAPTVFAYNFVKAYLIAPPSFQWPKIDPRQVIQLWEYSLQCNIIIYSDKSFIMQKNIKKEEFKFD
jgi:hypothetical protein